MVSTEPEALKNQQLTQARSDLGTFWHRARSSAVAARLTGNGVTEIVDVGAGAGNLGGWLAAHQPQIRYRFLEPMTELSDHLVRRFGADGLVTSLDDIGDPDAVTMLDVLEHIEDDRAFLADLSRVMRPGSLLVLTVPCGQWLFSDWDRMLGHHRRYSRAGLSLLVASAGFESISTVYLFPELIAPALARLWKRSAEGDTGSAEFPDMPTFVDRSAYAVARVTTALGPLAPYGTSLLLVAKRA